MSERKRAGYPWPLKRKRATLQSAPPGINGCAELTGIMILAVPIDGRVGRHQELVKGADSRPRLVSMVQSGSQAAGGMRVNGYLFQNLRLLLAIDYLSCHGHE